MPTVTCDLSPAEIIEKWASRGCDLNSGGGGEDERAQAAELAAIRAYGTQLPA